MQIKYFQTAWTDVKNSPGWFKNVLKLGLLDMIPILGTIVQNGFLYGWAREAAWNVRNPLPRTIFGNNDTRLWARGGLIFVFMFVLGLIPGIISTFSDMLTNSGYFALLAGGSYYGSVPPVSGGAMALGFLLSLVSLALYVLVEFIGWAGSMRISIYDSLSAGFNIKNDWSMLKRDTNGIVRIFAMNLLFGLIFGLIFGLVFFIVCFTFLMSILVPVINASSGTMSDSEIMTAIASAGAGFLVFMLVFTLLIYALMCVSAWLQMITTRALGYWTSQFNVPSWGPQDAPLPGGYAPAGAWQQPNQYQQPQGGQPQQDAQPQPNPYQQQAYGQQYQQPQGGYQPFAQDQGFAQPQQQAAAPQTAASAPQPRAAAPESAESQAAPADQTAPVASVAQAAPEQVAPASPADLQTAPASAPQAPAAPSAPEPPAQASVPAGTDVQAAAPAVPPTPPAAASSPAEADAGEGDASAPHDASSSDETGK
ncbi:MAG: DUF4013 domain-containing protein [Slackia sp.]|uniref:DUF4013 domain-containing protein n=1 Tax=uncultured Slackia sp. TaxID=665903 RepID=UPI002804D621|nr:DUF4013 domain-containing protein [uncultured Slackia sp.]MDU6011620.1 DUF4013 domain-containing protein [Slackia sp.]